MPVWITGIDTAVHKVEPLDTRIYRLELEPISGRTHQLRAHMAFLGCPILGDDKYGDRELNKKLGCVGHLHLWCRSIYIPEDSTLSAYAGRCFEAPLPHDFERIQPK